MSEHKWKPGDVAMVECSDGKWRRAMCGEAKFGIGVSVSWMFSDHSLRYVESSNARPLVTLDPEDREAVERLAALLMKQGRCNRSGLHARLQAALREFANPTPPKPDEPLGLGAVVEDAEGENWIRVGSRADRIPRPWANRGNVGSLLDWVRYADIAAVRVLSEGVTS